MQNNQLQKIAPQDLVKRSDQQIAITNKLLSISYRSQIMAIALEQPKFFCKMLYYCRYDLLSKKLKGKFRDVWEREKEEQKQRDGIRICFTDILPPFVEFSIELSDNYSEEDWCILSEYQSLPWSIEFIKMFEDKWNWNLLSKNVALPWSMVLIERYEERWNWDGYRSLSINKSLPWSMDLIEKYANKWNWEELSINESLPWSRELIKKYENKWDWTRLSRNTALPWSIELIDKYRQKWKWMLAYNIKVYEVFKPYLTDDFIEEIMLKITEQEKEEK